MTAEETAAFQFEQLVTFQRTSASIATDGVVISVDPVTLVLGGLVAAAGIILSAQSAREIQNGLESNQRLLNQISAQCALIIADLKRLRVDIDEMILQRETNYLKSCMDEVKRELIDVTNLDHVPDKTLQALAAFETPFRIQAGAMRSDSYGAYLAVAGAGLLLLVVARILKKSRKFTQSLYVDFRKYFEEGLQRIPRWWPTIGTLQHEAAQEEVGLLLRLRAIPKSGFLGHHHYTPHFLSHGEPGRDPDRPSPYDVNWYFTFDKEVPDSLDARMGFRFSGKIFVSRGSRNDLNLPEFKGIVSNINDDIQHIDGAIDEAGKVLLFVNAICELRDGVHRRMKGLQEIAGEFQLAIRGFDEAWQKIAPKLSDA